MKFYCLYIRAIFLFISSCVLFVSFVICVKIEFKRNELNVDFRYYDEKVIKYLKAVSVCLLNELNWHTSRKEKCAIQHFFFSLCVRLKVFAHGIFLIQVNYFRNYLFRFGFNRNHCYLEKKIVILFGFWFRWVKPLNQSWCFFNQWRCLITMDIFFIGFFFCFSRRRLHATSDYANFMKIKFKWIEICFQKREKHILIRSTTVADVYTEWTIYFTEICYLSRSWIAIFFSFLFVEIIMRWRIDILCLFLWISTF